jgi:hypothetical protein
MDDKQKILSVYKRINDAMVKKDTATLNNIYLMTIINFSI